MRIAVNAVVDQLDVVHRRQSNLTDRNIELDRTRTQGLLELTAMDSMQPLSSDQWPARIDGGRDVLPLICDKHRLHRNHPAR